MKSCFSTVLGGNTSQVAKLHDITSTSTSTCCNMLIPALTFKGAVQCDINGRFFNEK